ncbi:MAG: SIMPL domain-containing protein [Ferruginibacter sp.]
MKRLFFTAFFAVSISGIFAQTEKNCCSPYHKTITVSGAAEMEVTPDEIYVEIYLREYKKRGEEKVALDKIKSDFISLCKSVNIADSNIVVSDYQGFNNYFYFRRSKKQNPDLYSSVRYMIKFNNLVKLNELADKLDDEAVQSFDITTVTHSRIREFRRQLKIEAVKAAREKGIYLTEAVNEKLGEAISIAEPNETLSLPYQSNSNMMVSQKRMDAYIDKQIDNINYKKIKFRYSVEVVFALK